MTWFKVDDKLHDHRKARRAGSAAMGLWVMAGSWCGQQENDGFVPVELIDRWATLDDAERLVEVGFWSHDEQDGETGYRYHDWQVYQPTSEELTERRSWQNTRSALHRDEALVAAIKRRDNDRCRYCGVLVNWKSRRGKTAATYDHVVPVSQGGTNSLDNVVVACQPCNMRKGDRTPAEARMTLLDPGSLGSGSDLDTTQVRNLGRNKTPTRPDPTRPDPTSGSREVALPGPADTWVPTTSALAAVAEIRSAFDSLRDTGVNSWNMLDFVTPMVERLIGRTDFNGAAGVCLWWYTESTGLPATIGDFRSCARMLKKYGQAGLIAMDEAFKPTVTEQGPPWAYAEAVAQRMYREQGA